MEFGSEYEESTTTSVCGDVDGAREMKSRKKQRRRRAESADDSVDTGAARAALGPATQERTAVAHRVGGGLVRGLAAMDAYSRHRKLMHDYIHYYGGKAHMERRAAERAAEERTDVDVLRDHHKFLWSEADSSEGWEKQLAKNYYDQLFKEYALVDLSRYRTGQIAMRWRTEREVVSGKGQFACGSLSGCTAGASDVPLRSYEVNFAYVEGGTKHNALVKVRLCDECGTRLRKARKGELSEWDEGRATKERRKRRRGSDEGECEEDEALIADLLV